MSYYCGIDAASKKTSLCILGSRRQVIEEIEVLTESESLRAVLGQYRGLTCVVEAAPLAEWISREVEGMDRGHQVTIVCPRKAKAALSGMNRGKKTDRRDARGLAELCRSGFFEEVRKKSEQARNQRSCLTARKQIVECSNAVVSSIRGILRAHGIRLTVGAGESSFGEQVRQAVENLSSEVKTSLLHLLQSYELLHRQQRAMYQVLTKTMKEDEVAKRLMTIPSVGPATAMAFLATIDDPHRFESGEKVAAYVGLTPSVYQSGETECRGRITKTGDKLLRWLLVEAAHNLLSCSKTPCELRRWGKALEEKKGAGKARVAVARRLCMLMWQLWVRGENFHAESVRQAA